MRKYTDEEILNFSDKGKKYYKYITASKIKQYFSLFLSKEMKMNVNISNSFFDFLDGLKYIFNFVLFLVIYPVISVINIIITPFQIGKLQKSLEKLFEEKNKN